MLPRSNGMIIAPTLLSPPAAPPSCPLPLPYPADDHGLASPNDKAVAGGFSNPPNDNKYVGTSLTPSTLGRADFGLGALADPFTVPVLVSVPLATTPPSLSLRVSSADEDGWVASLRPPPEVDAGTAGSRRGEARRAEEGREAATRRGEARRAEEGRPVAMAVAAAA
mmetsp:Transcript_32243/g.81117  ORF Transcript_32243/g.81117 Transcript_32243/m.81117 type:complete len:167 (+) Transcript_32243:3647-4147(+)